MFIFGIIKAFISNFTDYNLYERKLEVITRKKYDFHFFMRLLDFSLKTYENELNLHESLEKNLEAPWKTNGILLLRNYFNFHLAKIVVSKIAHKSRSKTKYEYFFTTSHRKVELEIFSGTLGILY